MITIGITDSGAGGLAVLKRLYRAVPAHYVYLADTANLPYGSKTKAELQYIAEKNVLTLRDEHKADAIVLACNSLTLASYPYVKNITGADVFGCEPPVAHACQYTVSNALVVGTEYTVKTLKQNAYAGAIFCALPLLAEMVESGASFSEITAYIESMTTKYEGEFDCIVLGCTHYSLCKDCFARIYPGVKIFDSADGAAARIKKLYAKSGRGCESDIKFVFTSDFKSNADKYANLAEEIFKSY